MHLAIALEQVHGHNRVPDFSNFSDHIAPDWIEEALATKGEARLRRRRLPMAHVVWFVIGMSLYRKRAMWQVVDSLDLALPDTFHPLVNKSSIIKARQRLGSEPIKWLFEHSATHWVEQHDEQSRWRGLHLFAVDGTTFKVADTDSNRERFGTVQSRSGTCAHPLVRMCALMSLRTHLVLRASFGAYKKGETTLASSLWEHVGNDSLTLVDRAYFSASVLLGLQRGGHNRHWMTRARTDFAPGKVLHELGRGDRVVEKKVCKTAKNANTELPSSWTMRVIDYQTADGAPQQLLTSLLDAEKYPPSELVELYHQRWEIEIGFGEIKTNLLEHTRLPLRSQLADGVEQEIWGLLLGYNLVRMQIAVVANKAKVAPNRISFTAVVRVILSEWSWDSLPGAIPRHIHSMHEMIGRCILPERRTQRRFPRVVKTKMSNYPRKIPRPISNDTEKGSRGC